MECGILETRIVNFIRLAKRVILIRYTICTIRLKFLFSWFNVIERVKSLIPVSELFLSSLRVDVDY